MLNVAQILSLEVAFGINATFFLEGGVKHHVQEPDMMVIILFCDVQVGAYIANPGLRCASSVAL